MCKRCENSVDSAGKTMWKKQVLYTQLFQFFINSRLSHIITLTKSTTCPQTNILFYPLLFIGLSPVSTLPTTTTNLNIIG